MHSSKKLRIDGLEERKLLSARPGVGFHAPFANGAAQRDQLSVQIDFPVLGAQSHRSTRWFLIAALLFAVIVGHASAQSQHILHVITEGNPSRHTQTPLVTPAGKVGFQETVSSTAGDYSLGMNMSFDPDPHFRTWDNILYDYHSVCDTILVKQTPCSQTNSGSSPYTYALEFEDDTTPNLPPLSDDATVSEQAWTRDDFAVAGFLKDDQIIVALTNSKNQNESNTLEFADDNLTFDALDLANSGANFRAVTPAFAAIPEPSTLIILALTGLMLSGCRRMANTRGRLCLHGDTARAAGAGRGHSNYAWADLA